MDSKRFPPFVQWYYNFLSAGKNDDGAINLELYNECKHTAELLPENGINEHFAVDECCFCADKDDVHLRDCYAQTNLGHDKPKGRNKKLVGVNNGSVVPVTVSCCKRCRRNHRIAEFVPIAVGLLVTIIAFILLSKRSVRESMYNVDLFIPPTMRPFLLYGAVIIVALLMTVLLKKLFVVVLSKKTHFNVFSVGRLSILQSLGWVKLMENNQGGEFVFFDKLPLYITDNSKFEGDISLDGADGAIDITAVKSVSDNIDDSEKTNDDADNV